MRVDQPRQHETAAQVTHLGTGGRRHARPGLRDPPVHREQVPLGVRPGHRIEQAAVPQQQRLPGGISHEHSSLVPWRG